MSKQTDLKISPDIKKPKNYRDTLIIVGNGFDIWQGLHTGAGDFNRYFRRHQSEILKKLNILPVEMREGDGPIEYGTSLDMIYGASTGEFKIYSDFWYEFEEALGDMEEESIIRFFGTKPSDIEDIRRHTTNAWHILKYVVPHWIQTVSIPKSPLPFVFPSTCLFLTFNYTLTLQKRQNIDKSNIYHIHGCVKHPESIIFGHNSCPQKPQDFDIRVFGGSFKAGHYLLELLHKTDKKIATRIRDYKKYLHNYHYLLREIRNIYIVGHSLGKIDADYFKFLRKSVCPNAKWHISYFSEEDKKRAETLMHHLKIRSKQYELYPSIDKCLQPFMCSIENKKN